MGSWDDKIYAIGSLSSTSTSSSASSSSSTSTSSSASSSSSTSTSSSTSSSSAQDLLQQVWVPQPSRAVLAVGVFAVVAEVVSLGFAFADNPLGSLDGKAGEKTKGLIPDNIKEWLEENISSKREIEAEEKTKFSLIPTKPEILAYIVSIIIVAVSFSYVKVSSLDQIWELLPIYLATSVLVGLVQKLFSIEFMRSRGVWSEHKIWPFGLVLFLFTTIAFKVPFSSPTRTSHQSKKFTERLDALASASEIIISLAFAGLFFLLLRGGYAAVGGAGLAMCVIGSFSGTFPVAPMSGRDIFDQSKPLWAVLFITTIIVFGAWLLLM